MRNRLVNCLICLIVLHTDTIKLWMVDVDSYFVMVSDLLKIVYFHPNLSDKSASTASFETQWSNRPPTLGLSIYCVPIPVIHVWKQLPNTSPQDIMKTIASVMMFLYPWRKKIKCIYRSGVQKYIRLASLFHQLHLLCLQKSTNSRTWSHPCWYSARTGVSVLWIM